MSNNNTLLLLDDAARPFVPAPREYCGNMCGIRVAGLPAVDGGASDASLVLSWFYDRYNASDRNRIRDAWKVGGYLDVLLSWPDSRPKGIAAFVATCRELIADGFRPCVMLTSKDDDVPDVPTLLAGLAPLLKAVSGIVPRICIGWELSIWLSPLQVQQLTDAIAPIALAWGAKTYVHFQSGYFAFQQSGTTADYWRLQVGKLTGVLHQRDPNEDGGDMGEYQARITDCLERFNGADFFPTDSGFGHPFDFIALEITASQQFDGGMDEATGNAWGRAALSTPESGSVRVMGSGNGQ